MLPDDAEQFEYSFSAVYPIAEVIADSTTLVSIDIGGASIDDRGGTALAEALIANSGPTFAAKQSNAMRNGEVIRDAPLVSLGLGDNHLGPATCHEMARALTETIAVNTLDLSGNLLTGRFGGAVSLSAAAEHECAGWDAGVGVGVGVGAKRPTPRASWLTSLLPCSRAAGTATSCRT